MRELLESLSFSLPPRSGGEGRYAIANAIAYRGGGFFPTFNFSKGRFPPPPTPPRHAQSARGGRGAERLAA
jgi:hypothetical protein